MRRSSAVFWLALALGAAGVAATLNADSGPWPPAVFIQLPGITFVVAGVTLGVGRRGRPDPYLLVGDPRHGR